MSIQQTYFYPAATFPQENGVRGWNIGGELVQPQETVFATSALPVVDARPVMDPLQVSPLLDDLSFGPVADAPIIPPPVDVSATTKTTYNTYSNSQGTLPTGWNADNDSTFANPGLSTDITNSTSYSLYGDFSGSGSGNGANSEFSKAYSAIHNENSADVNQILVPAISTNTPATVIGSRDPPAEVINMVDTLSSGYDPVAVVATDNIVSN